MPELAINGGEVVRSELFPAYNTIGQEEKEAVQAVLDSGNLSQFLGAWHKDFYGGPKVQQFEEDWAELIGAQHAISVNSNTSGLFAAIGALRIGPGDEVIVSPYSMSASALAPLIYGAVPVFADINQDNFGLDPESIEAHITERTRAILVVHIFGNPAMMDEILDIANKYDLAIIEDCAQAPLAHYKGRNVGLLGDIGIFSFNYHKHIHTGEGGMIVTNNDQLAERIHLIRNHGENIVEPRGISDLINSYGYNFRMTEVDAAIGIEQIKKLDTLIKQRIHNATYLKDRLSDIPFLTFPKIEENSQHVYYCQSIKYDATIAGVDRNRFVEAIKAEIPSARLREDTPLIGAGYVKPLYLQPLYQKRASLCSFNCPRYEGTVDYKKGNCPVVEDMHYERLINHEYLRPGMSRHDLDDVVDAFKKVANNLEELK